MCEMMSALAAASLAAGVGGAVVNSEQNAAANKANRSAQEREAARRRQVQLEEQARQANLDRQAADVNARALAGQQRPAVETAQGEALATRADAVQRAAMSLGAEGAGPDENPLLQPTAMASGYTVQDAAKRTNERLGAARQAMLGQAFLRALGDQQAATRRSLGAAASDLQGIGGARDGSLRSYRLDLNREAETFRPSQSPLGDGLMAAGTVGSMAAGRMDGRAVGNGEPGSAWGQAVRSVWG